jgi:hypothetical protein
MSSALLLLPQSAAECDIAEREFEELAAELATGQEVDWFRIESVVGAAGRDMTALIAACARHKRAAELHDDQAEDE